MRQTKGKRRKNPDGGIILSQCSACLLSFRHIVSSCKSDHKHHRLEYSTYMYDPVKQSIGPYSVQGNSATDASMCSYRILSLLHASLSFSLCLSPILSYSLSVSRCLCLSPFSFSVLYAWQQDSSGICDLTYYK